MLRSASVFSTVALALALAIGASAPSSQDAGKSQDSGRAPSETAFPESPLEYVLITTSKGEIVLELNREKAPITVRNFLSYVGKKHYDGTIFHRVIESFMIQGGGFTVDLVQKPTDPPIKLESDNGLTNDRGTVAMARTNVPDSATSQFFINVVDNAFLNKAEARDGHGYAVFGRVIAGMNVVDAIRTVKCYDMIQFERQQHGNVPITPVLMEKVRQITKEEADKKVAAEKASSGSSAG